MKVFMQDKTDLLQSLKSSEKGLHTSQVSRRQQEFGPNVLEGAEKKNYLLLYFKEYVQFFAVLLEVAGLVLAPVVGSALAPAARVATADVHALIEGAGSR